MTQKYFFQVAGNESGIEVDRKIRETYKIRKNDKPFYITNGCRVKVMKDSEIGEIEIESNEPKFEERAKTISKLILDINQKTKLNFMLKL